jgi:hypothetical protein
MHGGMAQYDDLDALEALEILSVVGPCLQRNINWQ